MLETRTTTSLLGAVLSNERVGVAKLHGHGHALLWRLCRDVMGTLALAPRLDLLSASMAWCGSGWQSILGSRLIVRAWACLP
mmetsp:Transcript_100824/g.323568  ORF Transcript_100824/g.323568 Transcript_100824/m.323568 type:complete len:82 (-) Transcript_100824:289-534(-)